eukprot:TRINITY_DN62152_c0_g1_i1.p1 TRINITY_DN62152_c0_g1~~TRINITY_DN62152_c0_g1_i1.p1  ORF type:complete len:298 (-),score=49.75 TRINITY_DN62152_c0_g1_i1:64-957(-)
MAHLNVYLASTLVTAVIQLAGFTAAFALQTEVFYDILGGVNYLAVVACSALYGSSWVNDPAKMAVSLLFICSRSWLLLFLAWRAHERKGDARFDGVKDKFWKFLTFWMVQGMWVMLISMPMIFVNSSAIRRSSFAAFDVLFLAGFAFGIAIEVLADVQKAIWVKSGRQGGFCKAGVWGFSRHPNYFGEILQWWCLWAFAYPSSELVGQGYMDPLWWACSISPLFTMHILLNLPPTGIANAEGKNLKRYYDSCPDEYAKYRENTSILVPMVGYKYVPKALKRTLFFDFERFEFRPKHS